MLDIVFDHYGSCVFIKASPGLSRCGPFLWLLMKKLRALCVVGSVL